MFKNYEGPYNFKIDTDMLKSYVKFYIKILKNGNNVEK